MTNDNPVTLGVIVGNRGFFPDHLCATGRRQIVALLEKEGIHIVITPEEATNNGAVETLAATAIQCWTSLEEFYGVVPCTAMSMMSDRLMASACEADIVGALSMYVLQEAARVPAALLDWNNDYGDDPNKGVVFHCSNLPKSFFVDEGSDAHRMDFQEIIAGVVGKENTYGTIVGRIAPGAFTFARITTDDLEGRMRAYVGEGVFTSDTLRTFGGYGVFEVPNMQELLRYMCESGFEHHVAATRARVAGAVREALDKYMDWEVHHHA